jgi:predicted transposase YbfD/YdcC
MAVRKLGLNSLSRHFESLTDPRDTRNRKHLLTDVVLISVCGVMVGCDGPTAIARWAELKAEWLASFLDLPNDIPSRDCIRRVLSALKPAAFQKCFQSLIAACLAGVKSDSVGLIAIDGKTARRSHDRAKGLGPLHLVSAWATEHGLALGQVATAEKSNEITAIPELLDQIDVSGAVVSIDAMGCQREIAQKIIDGKGDYVLAVKDNQPKLFAAIHEFFTTHLEDDLARVPHRSHETREKGHGRVDERYYYTAKLPKKFPLRDQWPGLKAIGCATRITTRPDGTETDETRYYIASRYLSGARFADSVRLHWGIENSLHWVLDMNFREDENRTRERTLADNLSWLRRFAVSKLKQHPKKDSLRGKMQSAGWSERFLTEVLTGVAT